MTNREPVNIMGVIAFPNPNKDERVIRFIDSEYHTLFTIKDGESIVITRFDGEKMVLPCKYIIIRNTGMSECAMRSAYIPRSNAQKKSFVEVGTLKRNNVKQLTLRLTADEYAHVKQLSKSSGLKMEPAIRALVMGVNLYPRPPDEYADIRRQLAAIGNNINQIARAVNARGFATKEDIAAITTAQETIWNIAERL